MIKLTIKGKDYFHASKIEEVTLDQWINLRTVQPEEGETTLKENIKAFSAFTGVPQKALRLIPKKELAYYMSEVIDRVTEVKAHIADSKPIHQFNIGKSTYYIEQDLDNAPLGQYSDCTHFMNQMASDEEFMPYMMAIYCLKKGQKHTDNMDELEKRAKTMRKARAMDALLIHAFFLTTSEDYARDSQLYMEVNPVMHKYKQDV